MMELETTIAELESEPNFQALLTEYAAESALAKMPPASAKMEMYRGLEAAKMLRAFGSWRGGELIGFITVISTVLPHYSKLAASAESFFVAKKHRRAGAGLRLLRVAELYAKSIGAAGLLISAPVGGALDAVLPKTDYEHTNNVYFKAL